MLDQQPLAALVLDWADSGQPLQAQVQVDASDDLQHWRPIGRDVPLVDLQRVGKRLLQRRLQVDGTARYLRVLAQGDSQLPTLRGVLAELPPAAGDAAVGMAVAGADHERQGRVHLRDGWPVPGGTCRCGQHR